MDNHEMIGWLDNEIELAQTKSEPFISSLVCKTWVAALMHVKWNSPLAGYAAATPVDVLRCVKVDFPEHEKIVLTNEQGDTYTSKSEELMDFFHPINSTPPPVKEVWNEGNVYNPATGGYYYELTPVKESIEEDAMTILKRHIKTVAGLTDLTDWHRRFIANAMKEYKGQAAKSNAAIEVLEFLLQQSADKKIDMVDGDFYYSEDTEGDIPLSPEQIYKLFNEAKNKSHE